MAQADGRRAEEPAARQQGPGRRCLGVGLGDRRPGGRRGGGLTRRLEERRDLGGQRSQRGGKLGRGSRPPGLPRRSEVDRQLAHRVDPSGALGPHQDGESERRGSERGHREQDAVGLTQPRDGPGDDRQPEDADQGRGRPPARAAGASAAGHWGRLCANSRGFAGDRDADAGSAGIAPRLREPERERRAAVGVVADREPARLLLDDLRGQVQPVARPIFPGREERLEDRGRGTPRESRGRRRSRRS